MNKATMRRSLKKRRRKCLVSSVHYSIHRCPLTSLFVDDEVFERILQLIESSPIFSDLQNPRKLITALAHRVVHGGTETQPMEIYPGHEEGLKKLDELSAFAPLHVGQLDLLYVSQFISLSILRTIGLFRSSKVRYQALRQTYISKWHHNSPSMSHPSPRVPPVSTFRYSISFHITCSYLHVPAIPTKGSTPYTIAQVWCSRTLICIRFKIHGEASQQAWRSIKPGCGSPGKWSQCLCN